MEHSQRLLRLVERLPKKKSKSVPLAVPFSLKIIKKCVDHGIAPELIGHLHLYDLQCLLIQFDIQEIERYFEAENRQKMRSQGISEVRDISGAEAVKFLGR